MIQISKQEKLDIFENAISWIVVFAMYVYGFAKIIQFDGANLVSKPVSELTGMQLMWAFYSYSRPFALVLGFLEVLGGTLILIKRTRLIGCLFTSTILINIILQDFFYEVNKGAFRAAILYQVFLFAILWLHRDTILQAFKKLRIKKSLPTSKKKFLLHLFLTMVLFLFLRIVEYYVTMRLG